jgi:hypothetical protein
MAFHCIEFYDSLARRVSATQDFQANVYNFMFWLFKNYVVAFYHHNWVNPIFQQYNDQIEPLLSIQ